MGFRLSVASVILALTVAAAALAAQSPGQTAPKPEAGPPPGQAAVPQPFGLRLKPPVAEQLLREKAAQALKARVEAAQPRMLCTMRTIPVDPAFDAAIRRHPPQDVAFTIRTIQPPCTTK